MSVCGRGPSKEPNLSTSQAEEQSLEEHVMVLGSLGKCPMDSAHQAVPQHTAVSVLLG